jgi:hypothetical protein
MVSSTEAASSTFLPSQQGHRVNWESIYSARELSVLKNNFIDASSFETQTVAWYTFPQYIKSPLVVLVRFIA